jgi:hypothetical protein
MNQVFSMLTQSLIDGKDAAAAAVAPAKKKAVRAKPAAKKDLAVYEQVVEVVKLKARPGTKADLALEIVQKAGTRKEAIAEIMDVCGMTVQGATTYYYNAKKKLA